MRLAFFANLPLYPAPLSDLAPRTAFQQTVGDTVHLSGLGLHSGIQTDLKILPGDVDTGLVFFRSDLSNGARHIPAKANNVKNTQLCTCWTMARAAAFQRSNI